MKQIGWLIYSKSDATENKLYIEWFIDEAERQNISLKLVLREDISIGIINNQRTVLLHNQLTELPHFVVIRTIEPILNLQFEALGIKTFNSAAISHMCNHKSLTHHEIHKLNIPMVDTLFFKKEHVSDVPPMSYPFVLKEATGRSGKQVYFITSNKEWKQAISLLGTSDIVIQSCNVQLGNDVRVFIVGKEIVGAVLRKSASDFRANFKLGGSAEWYPLDDTKKELINKIVHHFDFDMVGIDFLIDLNGDFLFNEIEDVVGSRILSATSDINLLEKYISHIKQNI